MCRAAGSGNMPVVYGVDGKEGRRLYFKMRNKEIFIIVDFFGSQNGDDVQYAYKRRIFRLHASQYVPPNML